MIVLRFNRHDKVSRSILELCDEWWLKRLGYIPGKMMSDYGFIAMNEERPIMISFFYPMLGCELCLWGFQVSNPDSTSAERGEALSVSATAVSDFARALGYKILVGYPGHKAIVNRLEDLSFEMGDRDVTQVFKEL